MDIDVLKSFATVLESGSFSRAADSLCVTQSAVSKRIKLLEEYLHVPLLDRSGPVLQLTPAGQVVMKNARMIIEICGRCESELKQLTSTQSKQRVSFCCTPSLGLHRLSGFLSSYVSRHSRTIDFNCMFTMPEEALAGIDSGTFDLALIDHCDEIDLARYRTHHLPDDEVVFVSSPCRNIPPGEVAVERILSERIYLKNQKGCAARFIDKNLRVQGRSCNSFANVIYFDDLSFLIREVKSGNGISFISKGLVSEELESGLLFAHTIPGFDHFRPRTLVLSRSELAPVARGFVNEVLGELCPESPDKHL